jgi:hypothetical protein
MGRYDLIGVRFNKKGQRVLRNTLYPKIPLSDEDKFIRPVDGTRLDNLAHTHYHDQSLWWVIAKANGLGKGRTILSSDIEIRIPGNIAKILDDFNTLNR